MTEYQEAGCLRGRMVPRAYGRSPLHRIPNKLGMETAFTNKSQIYIAHSYIVSNVLNTIIDSVIGIYWNFQHK